MFIIKSFEEIYSEELCKYCECTDYGFISVNTFESNLCYGVKCGEAYKNY